MKRGGLSKPAEALKRMLGWAREVREDEKLGQIRILGGKGRPAATVLVGAATAEVKEERLRIARDAASAAQEAFRGGVVAGGGAVELAAVGEVARLREEVEGMAGYGVECVVEALKKPFSQIVTNAGFNPLEKLEAVQAGARGGNDSLGVDCDSGEVCDMWALGVVDPTSVKVCALLTAAEIAESVLRINTIIRKRDETGGSEAIGAGGIAPTV